MFQYAGDRKSKRVPRRKYKHVGKSREALQALVDRLNYGLDIKAKREQEVKSAFISETVIVSFRDALQTEIPNQKDFRYLYNTCFKSYFFNWFAEQSADPRDWVKIQSVWAAALMGKSKRPQDNLFETKKSVKTLKAVVQVANRFMKHLHVQMPLEYPSIKFIPFSKGALKTYAAELLLANGDPAVGQFVTSEDWAVIEGGLPTSLNCFINLMYHYGLRRGEALGFESTEDVGTRSLKVRQQLKANPFEGPVYTILKDKEVRETPHWFATPKQAYGWIQDSFDKKVHPDHLASMWDEYIGSLDMTYKLHDFRRTFITRALRAQPARDVQLAVGHQDLRTTLGYAQDDRELEDKPWKPGAA